MIFRQLFGTDFFVRFLIRFLIRFLARVLTRVLVTENAVHCATTTTWETKVSSVDMCPFLPKTELNSKSLRMSDGCMHEGRAPDGAWANVHIVLGTSIFV